jgi:hypothetical protein
MALGSTQPLTKMSTRNLPGGKGRSARKADNLITMCEPTVEEMWEPRRLTALCIVFLNLSKGKTGYYLSALVAKGGFAIGTWICQPSTGLNCN